MDEMEDARRNMILGGIDYENHQKLSQAKFDLYSRSNGEVEFRIGVYHEFVQSIVPYIDFDFEEETAQLSEDEKRKEFLDQFKSIDWKDAMNHLPASPVPV